MRRKKEPATDPFAAMGQAVREVARNLENGTVPKDTIDVDFKNDDYTEDDRKAFESGKVQIESSADDGFSGSDVRINAGKFYTNDEWEKKRDEILKDKLP